MSRINVVKLTKKLNDNKTTKVNVTKDDVQILVDCINAASSRDRETTTFSNGSRESRIDEYPIDNRFKVLCTPCEVLMDSTRLAANLKDLDANDEPVYHSKREFIDAQDRILASYRTSLSGEENLYSVTMECNFSSVSSKMATKNDCHYDSTPFMPIPMSIAENTFKPAYYNYSITEMVDDVIEQLVRVLRNDRK